MPNGYIESFNDKLRDEFLNENCFLKLQNAQEIIEIWRKDYNNDRPYTSLKGLITRQFLDCLNEQKKE